ncbi:MAG: hypothetical protein WDA16_04625 [Candidatus Thermoplasmatota archaeon]
MLDSRESPDVSDLGSVYQRNGGLDTINDIMRRASDNKTATCLNTFPGIMDNALALANENETTFNASLVEYAIRLYEKNFSWGDPYNGNATQNWSTYQADVPASITTTNTSLRVPAYGFQYFSLPIDASYTLGCAEDEGWAYRLLNRSSNGWEPTTTLLCSQGADVSEANWQEIILVAVRLTTPERNVGVTFS